MEFLLNFWKIFGFFWWNIFREIFLEDFLEEFFWEDFGRIFLGGILVEEFFVYQDFVSMEKEEERKEEEF